MSDDAKTFDLKDITERSQAFVLRVLELAGLEVEVQAEVEGDGVLVSITGADAEALIAGRNGAPNTTVLDAIAHIAKRAVLGPDRDAVQITVDAAEFRVGRIGLMGSLAERLADRVEGGGQVDIYGLDSVDRKAVHRHLATREAVTTTSAGFGVFRRLSVQGN